MSTPPPLPPAQPPPFPPVQPPPVPKEQRQVPTALYCALFAVAFAASVYYGYNQGVAAFPDRPVYALAFAAGGLTGPLLVAVVIASFWKQNRGARGMVRVLFWGSLFLLIAKYNQQSRATRSHHQPGTPASSNVLQAPAEP